MARALLRAWFLPKQNDQCVWDQLADDLVIMIFELVSFQTRAKLCRVCRRFRSLAALTKPSPSCYLLANNFDHHGQLSTYNPFKSGYGKLSIPFPLTRKNCRGHRVSSIMMSDMSNRFAGTDAGLICFEILKVGKYPQFFICNPMLNSSKMIPPIVEAFRWEIFDQNYTHALSVEKGAGTVKFRLLAMYDAGCNKRYRFMYDSSTGIWKSLRTLECHLITCAVAGNNVFYIMFLHELTWKVRCWTSDEDEKQGEDIEAPRVLTHFRRSSLAYIDGKLMICAARDDMSLGLWKLVEGRAKGKHWVETHRVACCIPLPFLSSCFVYFASTRCILVISPIFPTFIRGGAFQPTLLSIPQIDTVTSTSSGNEPRDNNDNHDLKRSGTETQECFLFKLWLKNWSHGNVMHAAISFL